MIQKNESKVGIKNWVMSKKNFKNILINFSYINLWQDYFNYLFDNKFLLNIFYIFSESVIK